MGAYEAVQIAIGDGARLIIGPLLAGLGRGNRPDSARGQRAGDFVFE